MITFTFLRPGVTHARSNWISYIAFVHPAAAADVSPPSPKTNFHAFCKRAAAAAILYLLLLLLFAQCNAIRGMLFFPQMHARVKPAYSAGTLHVRKNW